MRVFGASEADFEAGRGGRGPTVGVGQLQRAWSVGLVGLALVGGAVGAPSAGAAPGLRLLSFKRACDLPSAPRMMACNALVVTTPTSPEPSPLVSPGASSLASPAATPAGYGPADLQSAYAVASAAASAGGGKKVALIDAYDDPNAASDLATYRSTYSLPACGSGCFTKVNQTGGTSYPQGNSGWSEETSLDLDMVSAICPNCEILLVEATSASIANLGTGVNEAVKLGATEVSNSYGGGEYSGETSDSATYYEHPGIDITVSSGDGGYGVEFPAASQYVTAVGGTTLTRASNSRGWSETAWNDAGSGCSGYIAKPTWQHDTGCSRRTVADVSAEADPNTPVAVYDSYGESGWLEFGGTSVASPIIASVDALAGGRSPGTSFGSYAYNNPTQFNDVLSGSNGSCGGSYLCTAGLGYDGPTGIGTPNGVGPVTPPPVPVNSTAPGITGSLVQGQTLTASTGSWTNSPTSYTYQWSDCTSGSPSTCSPVSGATGATYALASGYLGFISVAVTAENGGGGSSPASATPVGPVTAPPPPPPPVKSFKLSASPTSQSTTAGKSVTYTITVGDQNGFAGSVAFTASGLPSGVTASFSPASSPTGSTLTLKSSTSSSTGSHTITIGGSSAGVAVATTTVGLTLTSSCRLFCF